MRNDELWSFVPVPFWLLSLNRLWTRKLVNRCRENKLRHPPTVSGFCHGFFASTGNGTSRGFRIRALCWKTAASIGSIFQEKLRMRGRLFKQRVMSAAYDARSSRSVRTARAGGLKMKASATTLSKSMTSGACASNPITVYRA